MIHAYIKTVNEEAWKVLRDQYLTNSKGVLQPGVEIDEIGTIYHTTGEVVEVGGIVSPVTVPVSGWHVNLTLKVNLPVELEPYCVNPLQPKRVFFGSYTLAMPEVLEDDGDTIMFERGIGVEATPIALLNAEIEYVRKKLDISERRALIEANLDVLLKREKRLTFISDREQEIEKRTEIINRLSTITGAAARAPVIAEREAATAEITRLNAALATNLTELTSLRATRDALKTSLLKK